MAKGLTVHPMKKLLSLQPKYKIAKTADANKTKIEVNTNCLIIFIVSPLNCFPN